MERKLLFKNVQNPDVAVAQKPCADEDLLAVEQFLNQNYRFHRNVLRGVVEFADSPTGEFRPLTDAARKSIVLQARRDNILDGTNPKQLICDYLESEDVVAYNPILDFLAQLPQWDGRNHVANVFNRLPGISSEQLSYLSVWFRSCVAHWLQIDKLHGNEVVMTLIGEQGIGKTVFARRLLPEQLQCYCLDHINLSNKFDKEMALTNNLLVNLDELATITSRQQPELKQTLSKNRVNGRPIYGIAQEDRPRYASFFATTNNPHPLSDSTGSRRYVCIQIPKGQLIDNTGEIDYGQLYAQLVHEVVDQEAPYWFDHPTEQRIQQLNLNFMEQRDLADCLSVCFRQPHEGEVSCTMTCGEMGAVICREFPIVKPGAGLNVKLGKTLTQLGFESRRINGVSVYNVVPLKAA